MKIFLSVSICFVVHSCFAQDFDKISRKVANKYSISKKSGALHYKIRKLLFDSGKLNFTLSADTIYFMQSFSPHSGTAYGRIASGSDSASYAWSAKRFHDEEGYYTPFMIDCVQKWDTAALRANEKLYPTNHSYLIEVIRITKSKNRIKAECFSFTGFFNFKRDYKPIIVSEN